MQISDVESRTLYLHDALYASKVQRNLVSTLFFCLLQLSFKIVKDYVKVLLENICYGPGYMLDGFIVLDIIPINASTPTFLIGCSSNDSLVHDVK